jgi:hypothetical protein
VTAAVRPLTAEPTLAVGIVGCIQTRLEFLARLTAHIPNKHQVMTRYCGHHANRVRGTRKRREAAREGPAAVAEPVPLALREARRRWAELLRQIYEVDPLRHCPRTTLQGGRSAAGWRVMES